MTEADLVIGAVLMPGAAAPKLVTREMLGRDEAGLGAGRHRDRPGRLLRDQPRHHARRPDLSWWTASSTIASPTCPARVARTSTFALNNATLPFVLALANLGWRKALAADVGFAGGLNVHEGKITHAAVAKALGLEHAPVVF